MLLITDRHHLHVPVPVGVVEAGGLQIIGDDDGGHDGSRIELSTVTSRDVDDKVVQQRLSCIVRRSFLYLP